MASDTIRMPSDHLAGIPLADGGAPDRTKKCYQTGSSSKFLLTAKVPRALSLTVIRKYLQQLTSTLTNRVLKEGISYVTKFKISSFLLTNMIHEVQKILYYYLLTNISGQISFFYYIFKYSSNIIHSSPYFTNLLYFH